jgi:quercetin dioxygenase-like cupin family protein
MTVPSPTIPADDPRRKLTFANPSSAGARHLGVAGGTYTILLTGDDTAGRYCLIDMYVHPGGGPPMHRHDFEETFSLLEGEIEATFRGETVTVRAGETIHIPANAPHRFQNVSSAPARLLCTCSPAGQEEFFLEVGIPVETRTTPAPPMDEAARDALRTKAIGLTAKYRTEIL